MKEAIVPHIKHAISRVKGFLVGDEDSRAARTTDVIIDNQTGKTFRLSVDHCKRGTFSGGWLPPVNISPRSPGYYGTQSTGPLRGISCRVKYSSQDGSWFSLDTANPYIGYNSIKADASPDLRIQESLGSGHHNKVTIAVNSMFELEQNPTIV